ncbi:hypothetical protein EW146_g5428 [Bondarzewia mesenterica]|uniref:WIBG Mago-binding domain-containing protein n=1 Tax=Bondarzewia mesenterica TaxID=1095465 RepID=A0A4S4LSL4_9AGAM|nr:hypothetical protein EW146_g5428 [Bondarzewia mesenterica]
MSKPALFPDQTAAGIAVDPRTLERVIPESRRPDGTVRKQIRIRPGYTPQEDVQRFRGTRQQAMEARTLPKGHIIGWMPSSAAPKDSDSKPMTKSAKKNEKRKEKRKEKREEVRESWDSDEDEAGEAKTETAEKAKGVPTTSPQTKKLESDTSADAIADKLQKLQVT